MLKNVEIQEAIKNFQNIQKYTGGDKKPETKKYSQEDRFKRVVKSCYSKSF